MTLSKFNKRQNDDTLSAFYFTENKLCGHELSKLFFLKKKKRKKKRKFNMSPVEFLPSMLRVKA